MRKVLVITYYWPPAGGPGVQRWLKFVKYFRDFDIEPVLYIPENPNYPIQDASLVNDIPAGIKIYSHPIKEPYGLARMLSPKKTKRISSGIIHTESQSFIERTMLWVRGNFFIPDARKNWIKPSVQFLTEVLKKEKIETIITTGPPHSVHLIGYKLKQQQSLKWLADFRDPWTSIGYHKKLKLSASSRKKHKSLEHLVLNAADTVVVTSDATKSEFEAITKKKVVTITNGYDNERKTATTLDDKFTISHIGSLLTGRNPSQLWSVIGELIRENDDFASAFELQLVGLVSEDVLENMHGHGLERYIKLIDYVSHDKAIRLQQQSQLLLLVEINAEETKCIIPGKLFEYMAAKRPILAVGPKGWEVSRIITETNSGQVYDYEARNQLKDAIFNWFIAYRKGTLLSASVNIEKYSRKALTSKLVDNL